MKNKYVSTIAFIDILFNIVIGFAFLLILAFILIKPESKKKDFEHKAEFIIILEWDEKAQDDIDLYVQNPRGNVLHYRQPMMDGMHLDKDDLGQRNDTYINTDGTITTVEINREMATIRGITEGEFIVNAHYYSDYARTGKVPKPLNVRVEVYKVNPYKVVYIGSKEFNRKGDEHTFVRFTVKKDGKVDDNLGFLKKKFVGNAPLHKSFQ